MDTLSMVLDYGKTLHISMWCFDLTHGYRLAAMLSISGEFIHRGDDFMHIESPYILY